MQPATSPTAFPQTDLDEQIRLLVEHYVHAETPAIKRKASDDIYYAGCQRMAEFRISLRLRPRKA